MSATRRIRDDQGSRATRLSPTKRGGRTVAAGTPELIAATPESHTGKYLGALLKRN